MRILDENNIEIEKPDFSKGYLKPDSIFVCHHEATEEVEEVGHYEVVKEYPNGGKDVEYIIDTPAVEAREAWDEFEDIQRFVPFKEKEIATRRIAELKQFLCNTDYHVLKVVEGVTTLAEIAETVKQRADWRKEINELEAKTFRA